MTEHRLLTYSDLRDKKGLRFSRQYIADLVRRKIFPRPVKNPAGGHFNFWLESEIDAYIDKMIAARDAGQTNTKRVEKATAARAAKLRPPRTKRQ